LKIEAHYTLILATCKIFYQVGRINILSGRLFNTKLFRPQTEQRRVQPPAQCWQNAAFIGVSPMKSLRDSVPQ
jgi:hypothetical protein